MPLTRLKTVTYNIINRIVLHIYKKKSPIQVPMKKKVVKKLVSRCLPHGRDNVEKSVVEGREVDGSSRVCVYRDEGVGGVTVLLNLIGSW